MFLFYYFKCFSNIMFYFILFQLNFILSSKICFMVLVLVNYNNPVYNQCNLTVFFPQLHNYMYLFGQQEKITD